MLLDGWEQWKKNIWICVGGLGAGAHSLGISRAHYSFESLFYPALTLSLYIYIYNVEAENLYIQPTEKTDVSSW